MKGLVLLIDELLLCFKILILGLLLNIVCEFNSSLSLLFSLLLLGNGEFLISELPEFSKFHFITLRVSIFVIFSINLILSALLNGNFHLKSSLLLCLEELVGSVFGLGYLFVQDFFFLVPDLHEILDLSVDEGLSHVLLLLESFLFLHSLEVLQCLSLVAVLEYSLFFFFFFDSHLSLYSQQLLVGLLEVLSGLSSLLSALKLSKLLPLELFVDLLLDEFSLHLVLLHLLDKAHLEVMQLVLYALGVLHFLVIFFLKLFSEPLIILLHLLMFQLFPLQLNLVVELLALPLVLSLYLLLSHDIAEEHLAVQGLYHVLVVVEHLIRLVQLLLPKLLLVGFLFGVNSSSLNLIVLKFLDSLILLSFSLGLDGVWPFGDARLRDAMKVLPLGLPHRLVVLLGVGLRAHTLNPLEFFVAQYSCVLSDESFLFPLSIAPATSSCSTWPSGES